MGTIYLNDEEYGGGTNVVANPSDTASDTLNKIKVGTTTYGIPSGGASDLDDLTDVNISSATNGQVLKYNTTTQQWENANESGGGASDLDDLTDVEITSPTNGQVLKYNSTTSKWENGEGGSGTTVIANPSGTATDTLNKVQIGQDIYSIPSGGSEAVKDTLFENSGTTNPATITLSHPITDYDFILFQTKSGTNAIMSMAYCTDCITAGDTIGAGWYNGVFVWYYYTDATTLTFRVEAGGGYISHVIGIKLGSSGNGYTETDIFVNSGTSVSNITLSDDFTNYDEICFDCIRVADNGRDYHLPHSYKTSTLAVNGCIQLYGYSEYISFDIASTTSLSLVNYGTGTFYIKKVIGIKY